jgi:hypothetical protein
LRPHRRGTTIQRSERPALRAAKYQQIRLFCTWQLQTRRDHRENCNRAIAPVDTDDRTYSAHLKRGPLGRIAIPVQFRRHHGRPSAP